MSYFDLIARLMYTDDYKRMSSKHMVNTPQTLEVQMALEQNRAEKLAHSIENFYQTDLIDLLIQLDFMTYIPFGQRGIEFTEQCTKKDFVKYKYQRMVDVLRKNNIEVDFALNRSIKKYCQYLTTERQNLSKPECIAATIRQIGGELDNQVSAGIIGGLKGRNNAMFLTVNRIENDAKARGNRIDLGRYVFPAIKDFSDKELVHYIAIADVTVKNIQKEMENMDKLK